MESYRSYDFERIRKEFIDVYGSQNGESQYHEWVKVMQLDESKPYGEARESFLWTRDSLQYVKEDAENKYYEVEVGFPWRSMNGSIYRERDLVAAALTLKGRHPSLNHKNEFWFSPSNPRNRWGVIEIVDGKYHEGICKALVKVPKSATCPICNGKPMTELIDTKKIVNVSLEGDCAAGRCIDGTCEGFYFTDPPFTFLTSDILPGIPMTRIRALESYVPLQSSDNRTENRKVNIKCKIKEDDYDQNKPDPNGSVNTKSLTTELPGIVTPMNADSKIEDQSDLAKTVLGGSVPDNLAMKGGYLDENQPHHVTSPVTNESKTAESEAPQYTGAQPDMGDTNAPTYPEVEGGASRNKAPERTIPSAGSWPSKVKPDTVMGKAPVSKGTVMMGNTPYPYESLPSLEERRAKINADLKAAGSEERALKWEEQYNNIYPKYQKALGAIEQLNQSVKNLENSKDEANRELHNAQTERDKWQEKYQRELALREEYKQQAETARDENNRVSTKYNNAINDNLALSTRLTTAHEEYNRDVLDLTKKLDAANDALGRAKNEAKKITRLTV